MRLYFAATTVTWWPRRSWSASGARLVLVRRLSTEKREVRGSNAVQWAMLRDALPTWARTSTTCAASPTPSTRRQPRRADPVQGRHRRRGRRVRRRVGLAAQQACSTRRSTSTCGGGRPWPSSSPSTASAGERTCDGSTAATPGSCRSPRATATASDPGRLARKATWLGVDILAVGTYEELPEVTDRFAGDLLVLTPWRPFAPGARPRCRPGRPHRGRRRRPAPACSPASRTPGSCWSSDQHAAARHRPARSFGQPPRAAKAPGARLEGVALHLPLASGPTSDEVERLLTDMVAAGARDPGSSGSATSRPRARDGLRSVPPRPRFRPRIGTDLWLGDRDGAPSHRDASSTCTRVAKGDGFGYRGRRPPPTASWSSSPAAPPTGSAWRPPRAKRA